MRIISPGSGKHEASNRGVISPSSLEVGHSWLEITSLSVAIV